MKAVNKFKSLLWKRRPELMTGILGQGARIVQPPLQIDGHDDRALQRSQSLDLDNRRPVEGASFSEGVHREIEPRDAHGSRPLLHRMDSAVTTKPPLSYPYEQPTPHHNGQHSMDSAAPTLHLDNRRTQSAGEKGHAHDPLDEEPLWLGIGPGEDADISPETPACAESPTAADFNIYDTAYQREVERIRKAQGQKATVYLTRRVDSKKEYKADTYMIDAPTESEVAGQPYAGWKNLLDAAREKEKSVTSSSNDKQSHSYELLGIAAQAGENAKAVGEEAMSEGQQITGKGGTTVIDIVNKAMGRASAEPGSNQI